MNTLLNTLVVWYMRPTYTKHIHTHAGGIGPGRIPAAPVDSLVDAFGAAEWVWAGQGYG